MAVERNLSNPFSTGGGGYHFEARAQALFVAMMLTKGFAPGLPCWPIIEIKLQGRCEGFETDDLVVFVEQSVTKKRRKLLGQIKHSIAITKSNVAFGEVIRAAWHDYSNSKIFEKGKDVIALITESLSAVDVHSMKWLLSQAECTKDHKDFFMKAFLPKASPHKSEEKFQTIKYLLEAANDGGEVPNEELYDFLRHFRLLVCDLNNLGSLNLHLIYTLISRYQSQDPQQLWSRIVEIVEYWNENAGTITLDNLPEDLLEAFNIQGMKGSTTELSSLQGLYTIDGSRLPDASYFALSLLIGYWNENNEKDIGVIEQLLGIVYTEWQLKIKNYLIDSDSPLSYKKGIWKINNRVELWRLLGPYIFARDLNTFKSLAISVLKERDPAFDLPAEERFAASIYGKVLDYSPALRKGIAEGLAIIGTHPECCRSCSQENVETVCESVVYEILSDADWTLWGTLNNLLPALAECSPDGFLRATEKVLLKTPSLFKELFEQEGKSIFGGNYHIGLLWALEALAWDERYLVRVCVALARLANLDPGGQCANRPFNSLKTILLPWYPQTRASTEKCRSVVQTLIKEVPSVSWPLLIELLPGQYQISSGSNKPRWRLTIPENQETKITDEEYRKQIGFYAELAVCIAGNNTDRLSELINHLNNLPKTAFDKLLEILASQTLFELPEDQRFLLWNHLTQFTRKHRRFPDAKWALPDTLLSRIENVAEKLAPATPFYRYQYLFSTRDFELKEENVDWKENRRKLDERRERAIEEIFRENGVKGVIEFSESVISPGQVGYALSAISNEQIEKTLIPYFLEETDEKRIAFIDGFISGCYYHEGLKWCDTLDKSEWAPRHIGRFLACLPFQSEIWDRVSDWLKENQGEYWLRIDVNTLQTEEDLTMVIEKLLEYGRPFSALKCINLMFERKKRFSSDLCVRILLAALSTRETDCSIAEFDIIELIKLLQSQPSISEEDRFKLEWGYLPLLNRYHGAAPTYLENKLAQSPEFFCEMIQLAYRSENSEQPVKELSPESLIIAKNAWHLLDEWKTPPGKLDDETFNGGKFDEWFRAVKDLSIKSGHQKVALTIIGEVLVHTPPDPDGLWIHRTAAEVLNREDTEEMRSGYRIGTLNFRGAHSVDPTGNQEKELAKLFWQKAEDVESAGFFRFAITLKGIAKDHEREAREVLNE